MSQTPVTPSRTVDAAFEIDCKPQIPKGWSGAIGVVGTGAIVAEAHLPAYKKYGMEVAGVYDRRKAMASDIAREFAVTKVYGRLDDLLQDPRIVIVDIATPPEVRMPLVLEALAAGKHVLSQKPFAETIEDAKTMIQAAAGRNLKLAVNQNARFSPPWLVATELIHRGIVGDVTGVTHTFDMSVAWVQGTHFDDIPHFLLYDYCIHWIDITRCWLESKTPIWVCGRDFRSPHQPSSTKTPWNGLIEIQYHDGTNALIRAFGSAETGRNGHFFWIHGTRGTIRGSLLGSEFVEVQVGNIVHRYLTDLRWYPDGFAGSMAELMSAVVEDREPSNSASHNLLSLQLALAACQSAENEGRRVPVNPT